MQDYENTPVPRSRVMEIRGRLRERGHRKHSHRIRAQQPRDSYSRSPPRLHYADLTTARLASRGTKVKICGKLLHWCGIRL